MKKVCTLAFQSVMLVTLFFCSDVAGKKSKIKDEKIILEPEKITKQEQQEFEPIIDKNTLLKSIDHESAAVFKKDNLIKQQIKPEEIIGWYTMMAEIRKYVEHKASNFMPMYNRLEEISNDLFKTLALNYTTKFNVSGKTELIKNEIVNFVSSNLSDSYIDIQKTRKKLAKGSRLELPYRRNVRVVLLGLAESLEEVLKKVFNDVNQL